jgi:guanylate kinase
MSSEARGQGRAPGGGGRGVMFILSSPSGAGKTTLTRQLLGAEGERCRLSVSATTRPPRPGEVHGEHYFFLDRPVFEAERDAGAFLEWAEVFGNLYGTPKASIEETLSEGRDVIFDIDWQGARQLAQSAPGDVVRVFILPPSRIVLEERLKSRALDTPDVVARRLAGASEEMAHWSEYDYVIINDDLANALRGLRTILAAERLRTRRRSGLGDLVRGLISGEV